jgi:hypothetical protein
VDMLATDRRQSGGTRTKAGGLGDKGEDNAPLLVLGVLCLGLLLIRMPDASDLTM